MKLKQLVTNDTIRFYRASLTETFSPRWQIFFLGPNCGTCPIMATFGSMLEQQLLSMTAFTGLTVLHSQVSPPCVDSSTVV